MRDTIRKAALKVAYDIGAINRNQTEEEFLHDASKALETFDTNDLDVVESILSKMTDGELEIVCNSEVEQCYDIMCKYTNDEEETLELIDNVMNTFIDL